MVRHPPQFFVWDCPRCGARLEKTYRDDLVREIRKHPCPKPSQIIIWEDYGYLPPLANRADILEEIAKAEWHQNPDGSEWAIAPALREFLWLHTQWHEVWVNGARYWTMMGWRKLVKREGPKVKGDGGQEHAPVSSEGQAGQPSNDFGPRTH